MTDRRASTAERLYCCGSGARLGSSDSPSALAVSISPPLVLRGRYLPQTADLSTRFQSSWIFRRIPSPYRSFPSASRP